MKHSEIIKRSHEFTGKASEISRQMVLAGVGIIWLFKDPNSNTLDNCTIWPLLFLGGAVVIDLAQYVIGGVVWKRFYDKIDKTIRPEDDPEVAAPASLSTPLYVLFFIKLGLTIVSYILIIIFLARNLHFVDAAAGG